MTIFKELSVFNRITFIEKTHSYLIDGQPSNSLSVTRLLKKFKKDFDKNAAAIRVAKRKRVTVAAVLAEWEINNLYSTTIGTMLHKYIENYYCNKRIEFEGCFKMLGYEEKAKIAKNLPILIKYFHNFYKQNEHLHCVKSEVVLGDIEDTRICGMSDLLCYNSITDKYELLDFKTNKKMEKTSPYGSLFPPFDYMSEGEINEYTIQLNVYKYFIEKYTSIRLDKLKIIWFNVCNDDFKVFELADIQSSIHEMFNVVKSTSLFGV